MKRLRVIRYAVQLDAVLDDGEKLTPIPVQPIIVQADQWAVFAEHGLIEALADLERRQNESEPQNRAARRRVAKNGAAVKVE